MENAFLSQKIESGHLNLPQVLIIIPKQKEITHPQASSFSKISPDRKGGVGNYELRPSNKNI